VKRRELLQCAIGVAGVGLSLHFAHAATRERPPTPAGAREPVRIRSVDSELAPGIVVPSLICSDVVAGSLVGGSPGQCLDVDIQNDADYRVSVDGPWMIRGLTLAAGERARASFLSTGFGFLHARITGAGRQGILTGAARSLVRSSGTGEAEEVDQEHHLNIHHWVPSVTPGAGARLAAGVTYCHATLGEKVLVASEPLRVREGERVRFHFFNASPRKCVTLSLPNHEFRVISLDGFAVRRRRIVQQVFLGPGERVETLVQMTHPGRYVLGSIDRHDRDSGFGRVVEYANTRGAVLRGLIEPSRWDYGAFGDRNPDEGGDVVTVPIEFGTVAGGPMRSGSLNLNLEAGRRYRLSLLNATGERQSVSLRGHWVELTNVAGSVANCVVKDTMALPPFARTEAEFVAVSSTVELLHAGTAAVSGGLVV
jgi:hypothetical protein